MKVYKVYLSTFVEAEDGYDAIEKAAQEMMPCDILEFEGMLNAVEMPQGEIGCVGLRKSK